jgi:hypothetical protein
LNETLPKSSFSRTFLGWALGVAVLVATSCGVAAQQSASDGAQVQREAMRKLSFLAGRWSGPVTVTRGPGEPLHLTQTEKVEYKLDGLILLVEGKSTGTDGKAQFQALATIAFDNASHAYRIRAYHDGNYVDTELTVLTDGFSWGFTAGPAHIVNTMHLTNNGEWQEVTGVTVGNAPQRHSMDMLLERQP